LETAAHGITFGAGPSRNWVTFAGVGDGDGDGDGDGGEVLLGLFAILQNDNQ
jgi:hypothetical protein